MGTHPDWFLFISKCIDAFVTQYHIPKSYLLKWIFPEEYLFALQEYDTKNPCFPLREKAGLIYTQLKKN